MLLKNGHLHCNNCERRNIIYKVLLILDTRTAFEVEDSILINPKLLEIKKGSSVELYCEQCKTRETITIDDIDLQIH